MTRFAYSLAATFAIVATGIAVPAGAQGIVKAVGADAKSICVRDLKSEQCGRYQDRILRTELQRLHRATDAAAVREVSRRQLDALIDSVG